MLLPLLTWTISGLEQYLLVKCQYNVVWWGIMFICNSLDKYNRSDTHCRYICIYICSSTTINIVLLSINKFIIPDLVTGNYFDQIKNYSAFI